MEEEKNHPAAMGEASSMNQPPEPVIVGWENNQEIAPTALRMDEPVLNERREHQDGIDLNGEQKNIKRPRKAV